MIKLLYKFFSWLESLYNVRPLISKELGDTLENKETRNELLKEMKELKKSFN